MRFTKSPATMPSLTRRYLLLTAGAILMFILLWMNSQMKAMKTRNFGQPKGVNHADIPCIEWAGTHDVVLVVKTGASEIESKLPIHMATTFNCAPNHLVFSDIAQDFRGLKVHSALGELEKRIQNESDPDLIYYRSIRDAYDNKIDISKMDRTAAWRIDRFKNIPMLKMAYDMKPDAKWYIFIDADTSILWANLLTWINQMDHTRPLYMGSQVPDKTGIDFAHGGSGYVVSRAGAKLLADATEEQLQSHFEIAKKDCCGDIALAKALISHGLALTGTWPSIQGESLVGLGFDLKYWCVGAVTFHHQQPYDVESLAAYETTSFRHTTPRYADIFSETIWPLMKSERHREHWENGSRDLVIKADTEDGKTTHKDAYQSYEKCQAACLDLPECLQFNYREGECGIGKIPRYGFKTDKDVKGEWLLDRIEQYQQKNSGCRVKWIFPESEK